MLETIQKPADRPVIATICGEAGMGKTSLACTFPNPIVIRAEDGLQAIPVDSRPDAFPALKTVDDLWAQMTALIQEPHEYKTLVIDSVTKLETMFLQHVVESDPKKPASINQALGGYGAGLAAVAALHQRVRRAAGMLSERRGMNVVFIAHADTENMELPDMDSYMRYSLRLGKKSMSPYVDDVDIVAHLRLETFTTENKKAISDGTRVLICHATAANVSKNRFGIESELVVKKGENPLKSFIKGI
jgi:hypothetical protein